MTIFEASGITVKYGAVTALKGIDLELEQGAVHGVIGPNGAGKSTLIDALSGRRRPSAGTIKFDGAEITRKNVTWRRRAGVARSFQRTSVFPSLTVAEQLEIVAHQMNEDDLDGIVDALELRPYLPVVCREIAYGTQRSVDLALALIGQPKVVLLDEPCAGLVAGESERMLAHVARLAAERNIAVLLVEHDVDGVFRTCEVITVIDLGQKVCSGPPAEVRKDPKVIKAYLGTAG